MVLRRMCPNRAHSKPGPTVALLEGGGASPIRSPCPGFPLPEAVTIPAMMERNTFTQGPQRGPT